MFLIEAYYNWMIKTLIRKRLLDHASNFGVIPIKPVCGIKGVSAIDMVLCKHICWDIIRQYLCPVFFASFDASTAMVLWYTL